MAEQPAFFTVEQFVRHSGLSESTVRRRIEDGGLPAVQPGGPGTRWLIPRDALAAHLPPGPDSTRSQAPTPPTPATPEAGEPSGPTPPTSRPPSRSHPR